MKRTENQVRKNVAGCVKKMAEQVKRFVKEEDAMGSVEIILILVILVGLVLIFRTQVVAIVENSFKQIKTDSQSVNKKVSINGGY